MKARIKFSEVGKRLLKWVPNSLTLCNSLCGFVAILYTLHAHEYKYEALVGGGGGMQVFNTVAILIFSAMIFDAMDGFAARILNAASMHGIQMDSLSDMVTFGVAPAVLVVELTNFMYGWKVDGGMTAALYVCGGIYLGGAALRLATYNVAAMDGSKKNPNWFSGVPHAPLRRVFQKLSPHPAHLCGSAGIFDGFQSALSACRQISYHHPPQPQTPDLRTGSGGGGYYFPSAGTGCDCDTLGAFRSGTVDLQPCE